ncbi:MAG TPA: YeeE/YedE thiosulfate transporter family protein, partial [Candidatus Omnitrophota bacterium]|nr:YeeE/YedE thiosulfate transporter family protein [Candidatus Omnitrophota bacterium]
KIDWQFMLVIGIFIGAFLASILDRSFKFEAVPPTWEKCFGKSIFVRAFWAVVGGAIAMIGARLADGCPSGHGLSGLMQLSVSGFAALALFFGVGIFMASLIYKRRSL